MTIPIQCTWLDNKLKELRGYINQIIEDYDNGVLTLDQAKVRIAIMCKDSLTYTFDKAFSEGVGAAELDPDSDDDLEEFDITFEEDEEEDNE